MASYAPTDLRISQLGTFPHRVILSTADRADYIAIDWRPAPEEIQENIPGRGNISGGLPIQIFHPNIPTSVASSTENMLGPSKLRRMPTEVLLAEISESDVAGELVIGVGGVDLEPVTVPMEVGQHLAVIGGPLTGRSTALLTIATALRARPGSRLAVISPRPGPLDILRGTGKLRGFASNPSQTAQLLQQVGKVGNTTLIIDDADRLDPSVADALDRILRDSADNQIQAIVAVRSAHWSRSFDAWSRRVREEKRALLLSDIRELAAGFDARVNRIISPPARGRGVLLRDGRLTEVQIALIAAPAPRST